jgi:hypothetical protein
LNIARSVTVNHMSQLLYITVLYLRGSMYQYPGEITCVQYCGILLEFHKSWFDVNFAEIRRLSENCDFGPSTTPTPQATTLNANTYEREQRAIANASEHWQCLRIRPTPRTPMPMPRNTKRTLRVRNTNTNTDERANTNTCEQCSYYVYVHLLCVCTCRKSAIAAPHLTAPRPALPINVNFPSWC